MCGAGEGEARQVEEERVEEVRDRVEMAQTAREEVEEELSQAEAQSGAE